MKTILLHINDDICMEARLQAAMDIARASGGHITCLQAVSFEIFAPGDFYGSAMAAAMPQIKNAAEALRAKMEARLSAEDVSWEWRFLPGRAEHHLLEQSVLHDIIIIGPHDIGDDSSKGPSTMAGELAIGSHVPVLVIPETTKSLDVRSPVLIAWNGSSEACNALKSAVPLLKMAKQVFIATIEEKNDKDRLEFPASEGAMYLSRHGIEVEVVAIPRGEARISDTLMSAAKMRHCSMVVMGAYGHSRLSEMLLGGVTRRSLSDPQMPIFMAH